MLRRPPALPLHSCLLLLGLAALVLSPAAWGQVPLAPPAAGPETVTAEVIQARRQQAEQATDLDEAAKQKVLQTYDQALGMLDAAAKSAVRVADLQTRIDSAAEQVRKANQQIADLADASPALPRGNEDLQELKRIRAEKEEALSRARETEAAVTAENARRVSGRTEIPELVKAVREQLGKLTQELLVPVSPDTPAALVMAQRTLLLARRQALEQSIAAYEKELAWYGASAELLPLEQRVAGAQVAILEEEARRWGEAEKRLVELEAKRQAVQARREAIEADPALSGVTRVNTELAQQGAKMAELARTESNRHEDLRATFDEVKRLFDRMQERVEKIGLTNAIGLLMRTRQAALPDVAVHRRAIRARQEQIRDVQARLFDLEDQRSEAASFEQQVAVTLAELRSQPATMTPTELESAVRELLAKRAEYRDTAIKNSQECLKTLVDLDVTERQLIDQVEQYTTYIDERVLWIRSANLVRLGDLRLAGGIVKAGLAPGRWATWIEVAQALKSDAQERPFLLALAIGVFGMWLAGQPRLRTWIAQSGQVAVQSTQSRIVPTLEALLFTTLVAAVWPSLLWYLAWRITSPSDASDFARAVAFGLAHVAQWWLPWELLRQVCRPEGLGEDHFRWPPGSVRVLRCHLRWFVLAGLPLVFLIGVMDAQGIERWQNSLGRLSFVVVMLLVFTLVQATLRPSGTLFRHLLAEKGPTWFYRIRHVSYWLGTLAPLGLAVAALTGYSYTAQQLAGRLRETVFLLLGLAILGAVLTRWVFVVRRRLAIERARQRRTAALQAAGPPDESAVIGGLPTMTPELEPDLGAVSDQTRRLLGSFLFLAGLVGIWWIWVEVLPALAILDEVEIWSTTVRAAEPFTADDGSAAVHTVERLEWITLSDLGLATLILLMTVIATRNLPGLLEIAIPQQLPLDAGARYAISTVTSYAVIAVGIVLGFGAIGIGWSKVQWLVAALGVGLGFGLQEIFANFVSGLIILFERPIRVGDVVTVDDVSGVVTRIQIRATTVTNWDRKEFIVPNKEFITGRLLNWTRADQVNRVVINVGIAYGSDTELARELLLKVCTGHPEVMSDPAPLVTFEQFGDSSLNFVVRCYLARLDKRLQTIHDLHTAIDKAFRNAGIEIPFPQRDVHWRSGALPGERPYPDAEPAELPREEGSPRATSGEAAGRGRLRNG